MDGPKDLSKEVFTIKENSTTAVKETSVVHMEKTSYTDPVDWATGVKLSTPF